MTLTIRSTVRELQRTFDGPGRTFDGHDDAYKGSFINFEKSDGNPQTAKIAWVGGSPQGAIVLDSPTFSLFWGFFLILIGDKWWEKPTAPAKSNGQTSQVLNFRRARPAGRLICSMLLAIPWNLETFLLIGLLYDHQSALC